MSPDAALISYCGLYCGECIIRTGKIAELAEALAEQLQSCRFEKYANGLSQLEVSLKPLAHYAEFSAVLDSLSELRCPEICKNGGGSSACKIRKCCQEKEMESCWQCEEMEQCEKLAWLQPINGDANLKNLRILKNDGIQKFLEGPKYW